MKRGSALSGSWETFPAWSFLPVSLPKAGTFGATRSNARLIFQWRKHHAAAKPISLRDANEYVRQHHRHHKPVAGHKFSIGCEADGELVGVIIVGRPVSRYLDDGFTLEVTRLCTNGAKNACSFLYGAAARAAAAMGYKRIITYTLESENGASLRASGWICQGKAGGLRWTGKRQPKEDQYPAQMKLRYEKQLRKEETVNGICSGPEGS